MRDRHRLVPTGRFHLVCPSPDCERLHDDVGDDIHDMPRRAYMGLYSDLAYGGLHCADCGQIVEIHEEAEDPDDRPCTCGVRCPVHAVDPGRTFATLYRAGIQA